MREVKGDRGAGKGRVSMRGVLGSAAVPGTRKPLGLPLSLGSYEISLPAYTC